VFQISIGTVESEIYVTLYVMQTVACTLEVMLLHLHEARCAEVQVRQIPNYKHEVRRAEIHAR
jgi:hypothetical protein